MLSCTGAPEAEIKSAYKKLALEWHSDKNNHSSDTATIRFQQATGAYQLLAAEKTEAHMSLEDILDLLNMMFFGAMGGFPFHRRRFVFSNGDRDRFYISDDGNVDDLLNPSGGSHEPSAYPCQSSREPYHRTQASSSNTSTAHTTPPLLAPVTVAKSPYKGGIRKPLATGEVVKKKRKVLHLSDSEGSDSMDFTVDEELLASVSGVMPSKRTEQARAAGKMRSAVVVTRVKTTPPLLAPVTVAKSPYKGGIPKPLATGEVVKKKLKVLHLSDSKGSDSMDFLVDEELLASVSGVMPSKRTEQARAAGKMRSAVVVTRVKTAIEFSRKTTLTAKIKQGKMASASPSIKLPAKRRHSPFDWFEGPDVDTTSESED
ncbi:uncharacterized protein LOC133362179 isoform X2 [Lethenteron reissneri]|uniref:uncharacterized protein LOC133362179 isoform X2 n=1 Tax=Lethenteron reissneri TaxID=7753 RepID=UPI002AB79514|nr:uncharacterized protein LOC133362179 isoform X2 [Lethenteron reissneri]